ncbi:hypothetical protein L198_07952 [Cryptococcus wingfieldii CBS 7118]|uniref:Uncharacterized protein n=1 Tax=Cryptococcus wingfieldii CBS 7118 TaxID=1295528 RepID=A0A1E3HRT6_9TREE|nr:hypothetical protein L198_07952 [Cryptococcus wingfieldii CBS 7118]ODN79069.1 hypothetical protein L198_07952 [Cryptococcus wingfieldii CBS 7118]
MSKKIYSENALRLYEVVELSDSNYSMFFRGLWSEGQLHESTPPCPSWMLRETDRSRSPTGPGDFLEQMEQYTPPTIYVERPAHLARSGVICTNYKYGIHIPLSAPSFHPKASPHTTMPKALRRQLGGLRNRNSGSCH